MYLLLQWFQGSRMDLIHCDDDGYFQLIDGEWYEFFEYEFYKVTIH